MRNYTRAPAPTNVQAALSSPPAHWFGPTHKATVLHSLGMAATLGPIPQYRTTRCNQHRFAEQAVLDWGHWVVEHTNGPQDHSTYEMPQVTGYKLVVLPPR